MATLEDEKAKSTKRQQRIEIFLCVSLAAFAMFAVIVIPNIHTAKSPDTLTEDQHSDKPSEPGFHFQRTSFDKLDGWQNDAHGESLDVFLRSCAHILSRAPESAANPIEAIFEDALPQAKNKDQPVTSFAGLNLDWQRPCEAGQDVTNTANPSSIEQKNTAAKTFFENYFTPIRIYNRYLGDGEQEKNAPLPRDENIGTFTGYFEPVIKATKRRTQTNSAPLLSRPSDLVELDLGEFRDELAGVRLAGYIKNGRLHPYPSRAQINQQGLGNRASALAWLTPDDAFFLQIQGSGVLEFPTSPSMRVGYAGQNGHPYTAIGKPLIAAGEISLEDMSLQAIRDWLKKASPEEARALREKNASFVFFSRLENLDPILGPLSAQGVQLTPLRSLAADRRYHAMGTPVWIDIEDSDRNKNIRRLMIIQDTGGAIRGPVRGDVFWGRGAFAARMAGEMNSKGAMTILLPNEITNRWNDASSPDAL